MKALVLEAYNQFVYQDVPEPTMGADDVLIKVKACGICGSDVHGMDGSSGRRLPPVIMGHEATGLIIQTGANVKDWKVNDAVTFDSTVYCGKCFFCRQGLSDLCDNREVIGVSTPAFRRHGAFAEYVAVPQHLLYRIPEGLSFIDAALVEPVSVAYHAAELVRGLLGSTVAVIGTGMVGMLLMQILKHAGTKTVIAVDLDAKRLEMAAQLGASHCLKSDIVDVPAEVQKLTEGRGADITFEVVGIKPTVNLAVQSVRKGGQVCLVGNVTPVTELLLQSVVTRELTLYGSCGTRMRYPNALSMIAAGSVQVKPITSAVAPLAEGASWFQRLYKREPGLMKVVLTP